MRVYAFCPLSVGAVFFRAPQPALAVIAKATYLLPRDASHPAPCTLAPEQDPLFVNRVSRFRAVGKGMRDADYASDFVPRRARVDVTIAGHAFSDTPSSRIQCALRVGDARKDFVVLSPSPETEFPLTSETVFDASGVASSVTATTPTGARLAGLQGPRTEAEALRSPSWIDIDAGEQGSAFQGAPPDQLLWDLRLPTRLEALNLAPGGGVRLGVLPGLVPYVLHWKVGRPLASAEHVSMRCDSLHLDTDREVVSVTFRGETPLDLRGDPSELVVCFVPTHETPPPPASLEAKLASARVFEAATVSTANDQGRETRTEIGRQALSSARSRTPALPFHRVVESPRSTASPRADDGETTNLFAHTRPMPQTKAPARDPESTSVGSFSPLDQALPFTRSRAVSQASVSDAPSPRVETGTENVAPPAFARSHDEAPRPSSLGSMRRPTAGAAPVISTLPNGWRLVSHEAVFRDRTVHRARLDAVGAEGSVNLLLRSLENEQAARERFEDEANLRDRLAHPGLQPLIERGLVEGLPFLLNARVDGPSLAEMIAEWGGTGVPLEHAMFVLEAGLEILQALEDARVAHTAISPSVLFVAHDDLVLGGLRGIREIGDARAPFDAGAFDPAFSSPEVASAHWGNVDHRSDAWSLAAVVFWMLSGNHVHEGASREQAIFAARKRPARPIASVAPGVPHHVAAVIDRSLSPLPEARFPDVRAMRAALAHGQLAAVGSPSDTSDLESTSLNLRAQPAPPEMDDDASVDPPTPVEDTPLHDDDDDDDQPTPPPRAPVHRPSTELPPPPPSETSVALRVPNLRVPGGPVSATRSSEDQTSFFVDPRVAGLPFGPTSTRGAPSARTEAKSEPMAHVRHETAPPPGEDLDGGTAPPPPIDTSGTLPPPMDEASHGTSPPMEDGPRTSPPSQHLGAIPAAAPASGEALPFRPSGVRAPQAPSDPGVHRRETLTMSAVAEGQTLEPEDTPLRGRAPDTLPPPALAPSAPEMVFRPPAMVALGARAEGGFQPIPAPPPSTIGMELARAEATRAPREDTALTTIPRLDLPPKVVAELMVDVWRDPEHRAELLRAKALDESSWALSLKRLTLVIDQAAKAESPLIEEIVAAMRGRARPVPTS